MSSSSSSQKTPPGHAHAHASVNNNDIITIDGSFGEGGGQIIRNGVTLAVLLKKYIKIVNIRANRPNPGLASQHLESILALNKLSGATTSVQLRKGLTEFDLNGQAAVQTVPVDSEAGIDTTIDLVTAGSVSLCVQVILPYLLTLRCPCRIRIIGGTHTMKAPNYDYLERVFIPIMTKSLGLSFGIRLDYPGYYPRGGGSITLNIPAKQQDEQPINPANTPGPVFKHFNLLERGRQLRVSAILNLTPQLYKDKEKNELMKSLYKSMPTSSIELRKVSYASIEYFIEYEWIHVGFYHLLPQRFPSIPEVFGAMELVSNQYDAYKESGQVVDSFMQDQLIIYMLLAKLADPQGTSSFVTGPITDHTLSAINVGQTMTGLQFKIEGYKDYENVFIISI